MPDIRSPWVNVVAAVVGGVMFGMGIARMILAFSLLSLVWAVLGFLVLGWAVLDRRRFRRGTPESEVDGGHTIE
jgi:cation transporter-like permease